MFVWLYFEEYLLMQQELSLWKDLWVSAHMLK